MANGYLVRITTRRLGGGEPLSEDWYAHIPERREAIAAVEKAAGVAPGGDATIRTSIGHDVLIARDVLEGEVERAP